MILEIGESPFGSGGGHGTSLKQDFRVRPRLCAWYPSAMRDATNLPARKSCKISTELRAGES